MSEELDRRVCEKLGMFDISIPEHIPHFSSDLSLAWDLQRIHPIDGVPWLMNMEWLQLPPNEVAEKMVEAWLKWKDKEQ